MAYGMVIPRMPGDALHRILFALENILRLGKNRRAIKGSLSLKAGWEGDTCDRELSRDATDECADRVSDGLDGIVCIEVICPANL